MLGVTLGLPRMWRLGRQRIRCSSVSYAGGGGGGTRSASYNTTGAGGICPFGGGGQGGGIQGVAQDGTTNTGGGAGGSRCNGPAANGGSGVVIIKYLSTYTASFSVGLTVSTSTVGNYKVSSITAGTGTVTFTI